MQAQLVPLYEGDAFSVQSADPQNVDASTAFIMRLKVSCVLVKRIAVVLYAGMFGSSLACWPACSACSALWACRRTHS